MQLATTKMYACDNWARGVADKGGDVVGAFPCVGAGKLVFGVLGQAVKLGFGVLVKLGDW